MSTFFDGLFFNLPDGWGSGNRFPQVPTCACDGNRSENTGPSRNGPGKKMPFYWRSVVRVRKPHKCVPKRSPIAKIVRGQYRCASPRT
jgi:hypothetical protein